MFLTSSVFVVLEWNAEWRNALTFVGVAQRGALLVVFVPMRVAGRDIGKFVAHYVFFLHKLFARSFFGFMSHSCSQTTVCISQFFFCTSLAEIVLFSGEEDWIRALVTSAAYIDVLYMSSAGIPCLPRRQQLARDSVRGAQPRGSRKE